MSEFDSVTIPEQVETITIPRAEYAALCEIASTAEMYLRTGNPDLAAELRDAVLKNQAWAD